MNRKNLYTNRRNIVLLAILCCFLWGSAYPAIKIGYELFNIASNDIFSKFIFAGYRFALAGIIVLLFGLASKKDVFNFSKEQYLQIVGLGIMQTTIQYIFFYVGMSYTSGVRGAIINGTGTFVSIILAHFIYANDKLNINKILGCIVGFSGVVLVNLNGKGILEGNVTLRGEGFMVIAAIAFAISVICSKKITKNIDAFTVTGYQLFIGGIVLFILGFIFGGRLQGFTLKSIALLGYMALLSSIAFVVWTQLMKYNKVGTISIFNFLVPVFGTLLSGIFLRENVFQIKILISLVLVCIGIYLVYKIKE